MYNYGLDDSIEKFTEKSIRDLLSSQNQINLEKNVHELMDVNGGYISRFEYFSNYIDDFHKSKMLVSGCAIGSELIVATRFGFNEIHGTEVSKDFVKIGNNRIKKFKKMKIDYYDGLYLPYANESYTMVYSGHVIEHTKSPSLYLQEHLRVLKKHGCLFLEFPNRYSITELHTGLFSFEYLPLNIRKQILILLSQKIRGYKDILESLHPISIWQIRNYCRQSGYDFHVMNVCKPAPGFVRMLISKI